MIEYQRWLCGIMVFQLLCPSLARADAIHSATGSGNIEEVRRLLKEDPKRVNARQQDGSTPIMSAAIRGFPDLARLLIDSGADVNMGQYDGWMPLHAAVHDGNDEGHCEVAQILIAHGANIEARRTDGQWTPLMAAALEGNTRTMAVLLEKGASMAAVDSKGSTALSFAVFGGKPAAIRFLLDKGADPHLKNKEGNSAIDLSLAGTNAEVVEAVLSLDRVSLHLDSVSFDRALQELCDKAGVKYKLAETVAGAISVNIVDVPFPSALKSLLRYPAIRPPLTYSPASGVHIIAKGSGINPQAALPLGSDPRYRFDRTISKQVLNNYLSRAVTHYGLCSTSPEPASPYFEDDVRMLLNIGAKFVGRAAYAWVPPDDEEAHFKLAKERADRVHQADPDIILDSCVFEAVYSTVERIPIPGWVFEEFKLPVEKRNFKYSAMLYPNGKLHNHWTAGASVPDMTKLETRMYFYYRARRYIDSGYEAIHFGQVHLMDHDDPDHTSWLDLLTRVRRYASQHARRHLVLCDAHTHGVLVSGNRLLFDFHAWPQRPKEVPSSTMRIVLQAGFGDSIYGRSAGGISPSGWYCDNLPYLVEFDTFGATGKEGRPGPNLPWVWGYDEGGWLAHAPPALRNEYLIYARDWVRNRREDGWLQMPTRINLAVPEEGQRLWHANTRSQSCPVGFNAEETIKAIWKAEETIRR